MVTTNEAETRAKIAAELRRAALNAESGNFMDCGLAIVSALKIAAPHLKAKYGPLAKMAIETKVREILR